MSGGRSRLPPVLQGFHPTVADWFQRRFGTPTEPQAAGWPRIQAGEDTLIAAPTGSGKTLAAFLACLDAMIRQGDSLPGETQVVYVSPLKALANDVRKNLLEPLAELRTAGVPDIRTAVRTGDTAQAERQRMVKAPPHVLVTTPESLYVLLTSESGRRMLSTVRTAIVDEIHAVARDKRGAHLALSLERLEALCKARPVRIGLSATQRPVEEIARFLVGAARVEPDGTPRCAVVDVGRKRTYDVRIEVPDQELSAVASKEQREEVCDRVAQLIREHRTTLVFVNTRRQVERIAHALGERIGEDQVCAHHGSLSREMRLLAEEKLKRAEVKAVVATASLELGIDIGAVELVVQLDSPRSISVALQRVGRAAHTRHGVPKARLFPLTRDQLVECAALVRGIRTGRLEEMTSGGAIPDTAQYQVVAEPEGVVIGQLDEDFAIESLAGDVFLLGNDSWRIRRVEAGRVRVENARGAPPSVPFWNGEAPGRTAELSQVVSELRTEIEPLLDDRPAAASWALRECALTESGAEQLVSYLSAGKAALGALPTQEVLIAERFFD